MDTPCFAADGKTKVYGAGHVGAMPLMVSAVDFNALYHEAERLRRDAERYRWLRDEAHDWEDATIICLYAGPDFERATGEELDAIIDIEMAPKRYVFGAA